MIFLALRMLQKYRDRWLEVMTNKRLSPQISGRNTVKMRYIGSWPNQLHPNHPPEIVSTGTKKGGQPTSDAQHKGCRAQELEIVYLVEEASLQLKRMKLATEKSILRAGIGNIIPYSFLYVYLLSHYFSVFTSSHSLCIHPLNLSLTIWPIIDSL